jgi:hypothetical protein
VSYLALARKAPVVSTSHAKAAPGIASGGLRIGDAHDAYEQEAERVADDIVTAAYPRHQWSFSSVPLGHAWLQRQPDPKLDAAAQKRLDTFAIEAKDLSNPLVTGQLRSMSNSDLVDYKNKVKDTDVKRFVESLLTFSTPLQAGAGVDQLSGNMTMKVGNVNVVVKPDVRGASVTGGDTSWSFRVNPPRVPGYDIKDGKVINYPGFTPIVTVEIVTSYQAGISPEGASGYGRGTTTEDIKNKATAIRFHEGAHGEDAIEFIRQNPYPSFTGANDMKVADFEKAVKTYNDAVSAWGKALNKVKVKGDCVGKTIDDVHKGEKGYKKICP